MRRISRRDMLRLVALGAAKLAAACAPESAPTPASTATSPLPATQSPLPPTQLSPARLPHVELPTVTVTPGASAAVTRPAQPTARPEPSAPLRAAKRERPFITPVEDLYVQTYGGQQYPQFDATKWTLSFQGLFQNQFRMTLDEIQALPNVEVMRTLECIGNPVGGDLIGNCLWTGTPLRPLLERARPSAAAVEVVMRSVDQYHTALPIETLMRDDVLLIYRMNGAPLTIEHGAPLRVSIPGRYGQKQPKWLDRLEAVSTPHTGYWEAQGWSNEAFIRPNSIIDEPVDFVDVPLGEIAVRGVGMTGEAGVARVEVSVDDGRTWREADLERGPSDHVWVFWKTAWKPDQAGRYGVLARLTDREGKTQSRSPTSFSIMGEAFPDGSIEMHRITASIVAAGG